MKNIIKNTKGQIGVGFVFAIFLAIVFFIFLFGGGVSTIYGISKFLKQVPVWIWVLLIIIFVFRSKGGKKR